MAGSANRIGLRAEHLLTGGVIFALATGLAFSEYGRWRQSELLVKEVSAARADADAALKAVIEPQALDAVESSVYLAYDKQGWGSAFVIDRERGLLGTAAHVADAINLDDRTNEAFVLNRHSKKPLKIFAKRIHAGYGALSRLAEEYQPLDPDSTLWSPRVVPLYDLASDAGVLFVDPIDPETGENILGPALPIAGRDRRLALKAGDPVASVSYPADMIDNYLARDSAAARADRGTIANLISPIDLADDSDDPAALSLIVHRMSMAPGSSGAPLFNRDMEIVGIHSHGMPKGDAVAQRAEVLSDLMAPFNEELALARLYEPEWRSRLERFIPARKGVPYFLYRAATRKKNLEDPEAPEEKLGAFDLAGELPYETRQFDLEFPPATRNFVLEANDLAQPGAGGAMQPSQPSTQQQSRPGVAARSKPVFAIAGEGRYLTAVIPLPADMAHIVYAFDFNVGRSLVNPGMCPVVMYSRFRGEDTLAPAVGLPASQVRVPKAAKPRELEVVFRRPVLERGDPFAECNRTGGKFVAGVVSWKDEAPAAGAPVAAAQGGGALLTTVSLAEVRGDRFAKIRNFADCRLPYGDRNSCIAPVKVTPAQAAEEP